MSAFLVEPLDRVSPDCVPPRGLSSAAIPALFIAGCHSNHSSPLMAYSTYSTMADV